MPQGLNVRLVMNNHATHNTPKIKAWLARQQHWHVNLSPTSASLINEVGRWFAELTRKQLLRGVHRSTAELENGVVTFIQADNEKPKPCTWARFANQILAPVKRYCQKTMRRTSASGGNGPSRGQRAANRRFCTDPHGIRSIACSKLAKHLHAMNLDRPGADIEITSNRLVVQP